LPRVDEAPLRRTEPPDWVTVPVTATVPLELKSPVVVREVALNELEAPSTTISALVETTSANWAVAPLTTDKAELATDVVPATSNLAVLPVSDNKALLNARKAPPVDTPPPDTFTLPPVVSMSVATLTVPLELTFKSPPLRSILGVVKVPLDEIVNEVEPEARRGPAVNTPPRFVREPPKSTARPVGKVKDEPRPRVTREAAFVALSNVLERFALAPD